jgi:hypothetical protein
MPDKLDPPGDPGGEIRRVSWAFLSNKDPSDGVSDALETTVNVFMHKGHSKQLRAHPSVSKVHPYLFFSALTDAVGTSNKQLGQ